MQTNLWSFIYLGSPDSYKKKSVPSAVGFPHCAGSREGLSLSPKPYPHKCAETGARTRNLPVIDGYPIPISYIFVKSTFLCEAGTWLDSLNGPDEFLSCVQGGYGCLCMFGSTPHISK